MRDKLWLSGISMTTICSCNYCASLVQGAEKSFDKHHQGIHHSAALDKGGKQHHMSSNSSLIHTALNNFTIVFKNNTATLFAV